MGCFLSTLRGSYNQERKIGGFNLPASKIEEGFNLPTKEIGMWACHWNLAGIQPSQQGIYQSNMLIIR
jgi:hypothetical protein